VLLCATVAWSCAGKPKSVTPPAPSAASGSTPTGASGGSGAAGTPGATGGGNAQAPGAQTPGGTGSGARTAAPRPFREVITASMKPDSGLFTVYRTNDEKVLFLIPDSLLDREMLMISRWAAVPANFGGFSPAGFSAQEQVFTFERNRNRVFLRKHSYDQVAADSTPIALSVAANNNAPIIASFAIAAFTPDSSGIVIDVTDFFKNDTKAISGLGAAQRRTYGVTRMDPERTFINYARSYPMNVEVRQTQTFEASTPPSDANTGVMTLEMNQSLVLLPREPMRPRYADARVGFFGTDRINFGLADQKAPEQHFINRWRLEPKDAAAYARGEVVEPVKPIVYYVDPATPNEYRACVKQGVEDWQKPFESAGFKNAIQAKYPPSKQEDPDWDPEDVRYSVVRWAASLTRNAQGPSTADPRTGEIIEADIVWYHNHLRSYRNRIMIETGAANPLARKLPIDSGLMCEAMRQVIAHEIGHSLGLPHNMISSSAYPTDSLRSPSFVRKYGLSPSIMDYTRQNYVAQPGDGMEGKDFLRHIGPYDHFIINWGYRVLPEAATAEAEKPILNSWIKAKAADPMYRFLEGAPMAADPRAQTEDVGDDPVKSSTYGIMNLKRVLPNLVAWTSTPGENYADLEEVYGELEGMYATYVGHVTTIVGGVNADLKTTEQAGPVYRVVPRATQRAAVQWLGAQVFEAPTWLLDKDVLRRIGPNAGGVNQIQSRQASVLRTMLSAGRIGRLAEAEVLSPSEAYPVREFLDDIRSSVWQDMSVSARNPYRRALQREHIARLSALLNDAPAAPGAAPAPAPAGRNRFDIGTSDVRPLVRAQLVQLRADARTRAAGAADATARAHLNDIVERIDRALDPSR
jgi:hypothetical protein